MEQIATYIFSIAADLYKEAVINSGNKKSVPPLAGRIFVNKIFI